LHPSVSIISDSIGLITLAPVGNPASRAHREYAVRPGEGRGFPEAAYDEYRRGAGSLPPVAKWRVSCGGAIALCLWMATLYAVEITGGQNFGEAQQATRPEV